MSTRRKKTRLPRPVVTAENLRDWAIQLPNDGPFSDPVRRLVPLAQLVITKIMGQDWAARHLRHGAPYSKWLLFPITDTATFALRQYRFIHFAEVLYELQSQPETEFRLRQMINDKVADFFFELEVAWWLQRNGAIVALRGEHAVPRYDADVLLNGTFRIAAEIKCKREDGPFSSQRIRNGLLKARDVQLPWDDRLSMVVVQLPTEWTAMNVSVPEAIRESVYSVFGCERRPWAVLFYWVTWQPSGHPLGRAMYNHSLIAHNLDSVAASALNSLLSELNVLEEKDYWMLDLVRAPRASNGEVDLARKRAPVEAIATQLIYFSAWQMPEQSG